MPKAPAPEPVIKTVEAGGNASFECEIDCKTLIWLKDNHPFDEDLAGRATQMSQGKLHRLEISDVKESDAGVFTAHATLADGRITHCTANLIVQPVTEATKNMPQFIVTLTDTELMENTYLRYMVKVKGDPNPEVKFYKDDEPITYKNKRCTIQTEQAESGYYELIIPEVSPKDAGLYKCVATNSFGEATSEGILKVVDDKKIFEGLSDRKTIEPEFQWIKDGQPFDPEERFKVLFQDQEDSLALVFTHVKPEDAGLYTCVASTTTGKIACSAELTVQGSVNLLFREPEAPKVTAVVKEQETNIGSSAMLETKVTGYPKPDVKWVKDDKDVEYSERCKLLYEDDETIALVIKNVTLDDMGEYKAVAQNVTGKSEDTISLNVKAAPSFTKKLTDVHTISGREVKLNVEIDANPKPMVAWYKDGKQILESEHVKLIEEGKSYTLLIESCSLYDVGSYSIVCKNNISQCSEFCKVDIEGAPIFTRALIKRIDTEEGDSLTFLVKVHGTPMPTVQWFFKGKPVVTDSRCKISSDNDTHTLTINAICATDAGDYSCQLTNLHGTNTDHGQVYVKTAPTFIKGMGHVMAQEKDTNVGFTVQINSFPKGRVRWFYNEQEISESSSNFSFKEMDDNYTLIIKEVSSSSAGKYRCKIENEYGSNESTADLTVLCRPAFKTGLKNATVNEGDTLTLKVEIIGTPEPQIKWYKDGNELTESAHIKISRDKQRVETYELTVNLIKEEDGGEYEVRAVNEMGTAVTKSTVIVQATSSGSTRDVSAKIRKESTVEENVQVPVAEELEQPQKAGVLTKEEKSLVNVEHIEDIGEIQVAPQLKANHLKDVQLFETWEHKFMIDVHGIPTPIAKWTKDGKEISASERFKQTLKDERYTLEIVDAQIEDTGEYKVVVSNVLGEQTASANLKVVGAQDFRLPQILSPLKNLKVPKGHTSVLSLVLSADPIPEVKWEHDGKPVTPDCIPNLESKVSHHGLKECHFTLTIPSSQHHDTGTYSFSAVNKSGTCECSARLDITLKPEVAIFKDILGIPYEDSQFIAVIHSNPRCKITWRKDGNKIVASDHFIIDTDSENEVYKLKIKGLLPEDAGTYTISAVNEIGEASADARLKMHMEEPEFTKVLENITVREYAPLDLKIRAQGVPKPEIQWSKDGIDLEITDGMTLDTRCEGSVSSHLNIPHFKEEYVGKYKVRAYSLAGHVDTTCYVKLAQLSPSFSKSLGRALEVEEGEPLELRCKVEASPIATVKWFKDGEELPPSDRIQMEHNPDGNIKLRIEEATPADCGAYKLVVENALGADTSICAVAVNPSPRAPIFIKKLEDVSIAEGQPLFMQAQVMGFPLPEMKWYKDGLPLRNTRNVNFINSPGGLVGLSVEKATIENAGNYSLTVTNRLGEATSVADVEVILKDRRPEFQGYLSPTTVVEGFPVKLTVKVGGNPPPELTWVKNGSPIDIDGERIKVVEMPDGIVSLLIDNASPLDAGTYSVTATNPAGSVTSDARLDVVDHAHGNMPQEPPSFGHAMRDTWAEEGSTAHITVSYLGNPLPEVKWFKNDKEVTPDHRITFTNDGHKVGISIVPCAMDDMDTYKCKLINPLGESEAEAKLTVKKVFHAPVFTQKLRDLDQIIGLDGKMVCHVTGNPRPEISWYMNGKPIFESNRYKMKRDGDNCILYIKDCGPDEDGYYKCIATNRDGRDETEAQFRAVEKITSKDKGEAPCFLKKIGDQELIQGMTGRFTACISGYPEPEVEWYRNNDKLYPSERISIEKETTGLLRLSIAHVDPDVDAGKYRVRIYNDLGEDECEASFIFDNLGDRRPLGEQFKDFEKYKHTGAPMPLADRPIVSRMSDRRLTLSWKPSIPYGPREPVTYQVEMCEMPNGDWFTARAGIRSCACEIRNLEPFRDYKFRVRVENKYGISDPSPYAMTYRSKLEPAPAGFIPFLAPGIDFRPESSPYFPKDFDIERPPHDGYAQAPRFLRQEHYTQYGVKGHNCNMFWFVYGYPKPKMTYFFNNEPIDMGGRYDCSYTRNGQATLFINKMLERDVGTYEAVATNEHGEARQRVHLEIAEYPEFVKRPEEMTIVARHGGRLEARVVGVPQPEIKWFKDWQPLASTSRIKMNRIDPDHCNLVINEAIAKDAGLYSITASNVAGAVSCSVMIQIEEKDDHAFQHYGRGHGIKTKTKPISDWYDLGDELGRGTQGVTYHAVERSTGRNFAAKVMHGRGELKSFMHNELEIMNVLNSHKIIRVHDAFETLTNVTLIIELAAGGEILDAITRQPYTTESEIASYIRQLLVALDYLHDQNIAHLCITPGDLLVSHPGGDDLRLADYGLARRIHPGQLQPLDYGMPEFVSPETVRGEGVDVSSDMWSVGVVTYLLLTGVSLFRGANDKETLTKVREGFWEFDDDYWKNLSVEARDFVSKLLVVDLNSRIDVKTALRHPWLNYADRLPPNLHQIPTEKLHNYYNLWKDWYSNASCRTWYRRRPLTGAFNHPSKMVYPPHYVAYPLPSPERDINEADLKKKSWTDDLSSKQPLNYDLGVITSESHYQNGPDTYLLQLRDVDFPVRIREYMKVAANRGSGITRFNDDAHLDWRLPVIRERRRFTDVMDEEIDDERKSRINLYGSADTYTVRRLKHEIGSRLDTHVEAEALIEASREGQPPFMREKPQMAAIEDGKHASISCYAVGDPKPTIQWYKNDMMFGSSNRVKITEDDQGRSIVTFNPANSVDAGIYKVVARNRSGQTVARSRVVLAVVPDAPDSPQATETSDTQVLLKWKQPKVDGNSTVLSYSLQYQQSEGTEWKEVSNTIDHEFYLVNRLKPATGYLFRLACRNAIGWSEPGIPSVVVRTLEEGCEKIQLSPTMKHLQSLSESGMPQETNILQKEELDYSIERAPLSWIKQLPTDKYSFISEISRGRFSVVVKGVDKTNDRVIVAKLCDYSATSKPHVDSEFDTLKSLRHERIATLFEAYLPYDANYAVLIFEKLQGADVLTYLSSRHEYSEQMVATIITQVLDGLQYLHWRNLCHLDLQPDNIVMASVRSLQVKLTDLGSAQRVTKLGSVVKFQSDMEFTAPEVLCQEPAYPQSDIWSVGVLAYVMLSGVSPFLGETPGETRQNINFVRFRFEHLYKELTQEATRFIMLLFKRAPTKRPCAEECQEHRWLLPSEYMIKRRERAVFLGSRIKEFSDRYHQTKQEQASSIETLTNLVAGKDLQRSNSIVEELDTNIQ
uniref:Muscle M-line assembly protein unc-89 n=1 Tax=Lygus hesperus TaxID=30085 RepID=A0A0A9VUL5_LYGHE